MDDGAALRIGAIVLDCPDPMALAGFYAALLRWEAPRWGEAVDQDGAEDDWVEVVDPAGGPTMSFQRDPAYRAPTWPDPERPQMVHLDVRVADLAAEHERVVRLGAAPLTDAGGSFRVYADPVGHPFCLCVC